MGLVTGKEYGEYTQATYGYDRRWYVISGHFDEVCTARCITRNHAYTVPAGPESVQRMMRTFCPAFT
jgi:hypothetical protein